MFEMNKSLAREERKKETHYKEDTNECGGQTNTVDINNNNNNNSQWRHDFEFICKLYRLKDDLKSLVGIS